MAVSLKDRLLFFKIMLDSTMGYGKIKTMNEVNIRYRIGSRREIVKNNLTKLLISI